MASSPELSSPESEVTFARNLGLFDATMIGIGAMIGAGIFVLTGIAAGEAGPGALLDFLVERPADFDLLVVGATKDKFLEKAAVGPFSSQIAMRSDCSVAVVRVAPAVKKIMPI